MNYIITRNRNKYRIHYYHIVWYTYLLDQLLIKKEEHLSSTFSLFQSLGIGVSLGNTGNNIQLCRIFDTGIIELWVWALVGLEATKGSILLIKYILPFEADGCDGIGEYHSIYANGEVG